jgi:hypothetical protein
VIKPLPRASRKLQTPGAKRIQTQSTVYKAKATESEWKFWGYCLYGPYDKGHENILLCVYRECIFQTKNKGVPADKII